MKPLNKHTIDVLRYKACVASETVDPDDRETDCWIDVEASCKRVADVGTVEKLAAEKLAKEELENYLGSDMRPSERLAIVTDLCRAGYYEEFDPESVSTHRQRTIKVDGKRYVTG